MSEIQPAPKEQASVPLKRTSEAITRTIAGETVLVPIAKPHNPITNYYLFNKVGSFLWKQLDGNRSAKELAALVRAEFAVPETRDVEADVEAFLEKLKVRELAHSDRESDR